VGFLRRLGFTAVFASALAPVAYGQAPQSATTYLGPNDGVKLTCPSNFNSDGPVVSRGGWAIMPNDQRLSAVVKRDNMMVCEYGELWRSLQRPLPSPTCELYREGARFPQEPSPARRGQTDPPRCFVPGGGGPSSCFMVCPR
jgi:hypothetical protein